MPRPARKAGHRAIGASVRPGPRTVLLHFHIFKNAGSTLDEALKIAFGPDWSEVEGDDPNRALDWSAAFRLLEANPNIKVLSSHTARFPPPSRAGFRFIPLFLIRHPLDRLAAIYYFERQNPTTTPNEATRVARSGTLADFMQFALADSAEVPSAVCDAQTSWLARAGLYRRRPNPTDLARAKSVVASAVAIGVVEKMDLYLTMLEARLADFGPKLDLASADRNRNPQRPATLLARLRELRSQLPAGLWRELRKRNRLDLELWRFTYRLARTRFSQMPDAPERLAGFRRRKSSAGRVSAPEGTVAGKTELGWTGERLVPSARGDFVAEHLHRYALAAEFAAHCDVLDVACGEGYGAALLARVAGRVTGVDSDASTIAHAAAKYSEGNLHFLVGRAEKLPLPDHSIDLVVSFETLEHLDDHQAMLGEIKRVLRPNGRLLISTPDCKPYQMVSGKTNPFHVRELDLQEFKNLLDRHFRHATFGLQKSISGSWVVPMETRSVAQAEYSGNFSQVTKANAGVDAPYLVALASDGPVSPLPSSFFNSTQELVSAMQAIELERKNDQQAYVRLEAEFAERTAWAKILEVDLQKARDEVGRLQAEATELKNWAKSLDAEVRKARALIVERTKLVEKQTAWAVSLEKDLRAAQKHFEKLTGEYAERTAWGKSLEDDLAKTRGIVAERDQLIDDRTAWGRALERDLLAARSEVERLQEEHKAAITWGRSLETALEQGRQDYARLEAEFADRTAWAKSLDAELLLTKADRDRSLNESLELGRNLADITAACGRLAAVLPGRTIGSEAEMITLCQRVIADLQRDLASKDADLRAALATARDAGLRNEGAEAEVRRLGVALSEAQIHVDNLLVQTERLQQLAHDHSAAQLMAEAAQRDTKNELLLRLTELQEIGRKLTGYENLFVCRLFFRWFGANSTSNLSTQPPRPPPA